MTEKQIIKSLECCLNADGCKKCAFNVHSANCIKILMRHTIDLINRQKAKIGELEVARKKQAQFLSEERAQKYELIDKLSTIRFEACKEFAKRLCNNRVANDPVVIAVNVELKQMKEMSDENL